jgi:hypothetical protein
MSKPDAAGLPNIIAPGQGNHDHLNGLEIVTDGG